MPSSAASSVGPRRHIAIAPVLSQVDGVFGQYTRSAPTMGPMKEEEEESFCAADVSVSASMPSIRSSLEPQLSETASDSDSRPARTAGLEAMTNFRWRRDPYKFEAVVRNVREQKSVKASDAFSLVQSSLMAKEMLVCCGSTPQPADYLLSCAYYTHAELEAAAASHAAQDSNFVATCVDATPVVVGQTGYTGTPAVHRGVFAVLAPTVAMAPLAIHAKRTAVRGRTHTGLLHSFTASADVWTLFAGVHQHAYYDREGVWIALSRRAAREVALFELVMQAYRNKVPTGRPMAPLTVELCRSSKITEQLAGAM